MAWKKVKVGENEFEISSSSFWMVIFGFIAIVIIITAVTSFYSVDANERGVVVRLGKFHHTSNPGLRWKIPWNVDKLYKVKVDYQYKEEFGFRTLSAGVKSRYSSGVYTDEAWILNGDMKISDVKWIVQYRIDDPVAALFNVRDVQGTIRNVSESVMRKVIGDRSFHETLQVERVQIANIAKEKMQDIMDSYKIGISIKLVQLKEVLPPEPVRDSFNEVNRAKQEQETVINEAQRIYNKEIYKVEGEAQKILQEAKGYAINRTNRAEGDANLFESVFSEYVKAKNITRKRLYLETMEQVYEKIDKKYIVDKDLKNTVLPLLNLSGKEVLK